MATNNTKIYNNNNNNNNNNDNNINKKKQKQKLKRAIEVVQKSQRPHTRRNTIDLFA